jgi:ferritin-like metal-binding protein YciE
MKLESLNELLIEELKDLYDAEHQLTQALPKMAKAATSEPLQTAFNHHLTETENQISRLEQVFEAMGEKATRKTCKAMKGLVEEGDELMKEDAEPEVLDAGLIAAAQKVEHYEIASYGTVRAYAQLLGLN